MKNQKFIVEKVFSLKISDSKKNSSLNFESENNFRNFHSKFSYLAKINPSNLKVSDFRNRLLGFIFLLLPEFKQKIVFTFDPCDLINSQSNYSTRP